MLGVVKTATIQYKNVPRSIGLVVSGGMATLNETDTVYGLEAVYDLLEIMFVDSYNKTLSTPMED